MDTPLLDDGSQSGENGSNVQHIEEQKENLTPEIGKRIEALRKRGRPVTVLVIGPYFVGKSTLINAMFRDVQAKATHGTTCVTSKVRVHRGEYEGVEIRIFDTPGFRDTGGKSHHTILLEIAKRSKFDLILICTKLQDEADPHMLSELAFYLHKDMWKRTVVVFTFANMFMQLKSVKESNDVEGALKVQVNELKASVFNVLSEYGIKNEVLDDIPFCIAGSTDQMKLPTTDDWFNTLWETCIDRCSDEVRPFLSFYARYRRGIIETGSFLGFVSAGAVAGSIVPGAGTAIGAGVGGVFCLIGIGLGRIFKK